MLKEKYLTRAFIGAGIEVHRTLGPGLLESVYAACLAHELTPRVVPFRTEVELPVEYKGVRLDCGHRIDFLVAERIIVGLKAVSALLPVHEALLLTYLRLSGCRVGLLMNSNVPVLKDGIIQRVL